jgi:hypothetical protein
MPGGRSGYIMCVSAHARVRMHVWAAGGEGIMCSVCTRVCLQGEKQLGRVRRWGLGSARTTDERTQHSYALRRTAAGARTTANLKTLFGVVGAAISEEDQDAFMQETFM